MTDLLYIFLGIVVLYVLPMIIYRQLNYYNYIRRYTHKISCVEWYMPIINIVGIFIEIFIAIYQGFGVNIDFSGDSWVDKKADYQRKKKRDIIIKKRKNNHVNEGREEGCTW